MSEKHPKLIRVGGPLHRVTLKMEPCQPIDGPITDGPLIRVGGPLHRATLQMKPVPRTTLLLKCSASPGVTADAVVEKFRSLLDLFTGLGFCWDRDLTTNEPGQVAIHLVPTNSQSAEQVKWLAERLPSVLAIIPGVTQPTATEVPAIKM